VKLPFGWTLSREAKAHTFGDGDALQRLRAIVAGGSFDSLVTPDNCMQSPTVNAIVGAVSRRIAVSPVHVYRKTVDKNGIEAKAKLPTHPVAKLLAFPNSWQTRYDYWQDAASCMMRHGRYHAWKSRGATGPIRELLPIKPGRVSLQQDEKNWRVTCRIDGQETDITKLHSVRGPARDFLCGDSPVNDVNVAIALEILAERFGASFFQNGALPLLVFQYMQGAARFRSEDDEKKFIEDFQHALGGSNRFRGMLVPKGIDKPFVVPLENDKAQFLETRKYQRTVIAGAFGVPPHLVGDLERATFNNVEQQDTDFTSNVVQPIAHAFEAAMERDLLTDEDVNSGVIIRFNLDSILRADFKSRQEGLQIQRRNGVRNVNEWREIEGLNPIAEDQGGEDYIHESNMVVAGEEPPPEAPAAPKAPAMLRDDSMAEPKFVFNLPAPQVNVTPQTKVDVLVEPQSIRIDGSTVNVKSPDISIDAPVRVAAPTITIAPPNVTVTPSDITINGGTPVVNLTNDVKTPEVHVQATQVTVPPPQITVTPQAPNVIVHNDVKTPEVLIEPAQVHIENNVQPAQVLVENKVETPEVNVAAPNVTVNAPKVTVKNELPEYQTLEQEHQRDAQGRISKTVTLRKRKG
jgi:HK97 family phage portal protein